MKIETQVIEQINHEDITQIKLINDVAVEVHLLTLGATWQALLVPQPDGRVKNIVLGHHKPSDYLNNGICAGQSIGRVAGRINYGQLNLEGKAYQLDQNNNGHCLHGGYEGSHRQNWAYKTFETTDTVGVKFTYHAKEAMDHFPNDMTVSAVYQWDNHNMLTVTYEASDLTGMTVFNPTNHVYFNLGESEDLAHHTLVIDADHYLETDDDLIPSGHLLAVDHTAYDFRQAKNVMQAIQETGGLDDAFVVNHHAPIAILTDELSGDVVKLYSQRNGLVVYSFNFPENHVYFSRSQGRVNQQHEGLALEAQTLPDAIHHAHFGDIVVHPEQHVSHTIKYQFDFKSMEVKS